MNAKRAKLIRQAARARMNSRLIKHEDYVHDGEKVVLLPMTMKGIYRHLKRTTNG